MRRESYESRICLWKGSKTPEAPHTATVTQNPQPRPRSIATDMSWHKGSLEERETAPFQAAVWDHLSIDAPFRAARKTADDNEARHAKISAAILIAYYSGARDTFANLESN